MTFLVFMNGYEMPVPDGKSIKEIQYDNTSMEIVYVGFLKDWASYPFLDGLKRAAFMFVVDDDEEEILAMVNHHIIKITFEDPEEDPDEQDDVDNPSPTEEEEEPENEPMPDEIQVFQRLPQQEERKKKGWAFWEK